METGSKSISNRFFIKRENLDGNILNVSNVNGSGKWSTVYTGVVEIPEPNLWCLTLILFPAACIFGNFLVVIAVLSERSLKTSTNYLLVSLACADLLVGTLVMPFSVYLTINRLNWFLPNAVCNFFCVADVSASTASIVHLVAISIDRFYAVVRHMEYKSPRHRRRIYCTILFSWVFSIVIGLPLGIGMNQWDDWTDSQQDPYQCGIVNPDYMLYMTLFAFYIPCLVMIAMYGVVFYRLHRRMRAVKLQEMAAGQIVRFGDNLGNIFQSAYGNQENLRRASMMWAMPFLKTIEATIAENEDEMSSEELDELTTILHTLESEPRKQKMEDIPETMDADEEDEVIGLCLATGRRVSDMVARARQRLRSSGSGPSRTRTSADADSSSFVTSPVGMGHGGGVRRRGSFYKAKQKFRTLKDRAIELLMKLKSKQGMAIRKETRATKLVATVMLLFLLCYMPFFTLNIVKVFMLRTNTWNIDLEGLFIFFTWLGYFNSCLNPLIYSLFNRKFRVAFQKLLHCQAEYPNRSRASRKRLSRAIGDSDERKSWIASQRFTTSPARLTAQRKWKLTSRLSPAPNGLSPSVTKSPAPEPKPLPVLAIQRPSTVGNSDFDIAQRLSSLILSKSMSLSSMRSRLSSTLSRSSTRSSRSYRLHSDDRDEEEEGTEDQRSISLRCNKVAPAVDAELVMLRRAQFTGYKLVLDQILDLNEPVEV